MADGCIRRRSEKCAVTGYQLPIDMTLTQIPASDMNLARLERLCRKAVRVMSLDLSGMRVLTEAATGAFAATPALAAFAGAAEVIAVSRSSRWGAADKAFGEVAALAQRLGVLSKITFKTGAASDFASGCDLVTNLGFVRPIDRTLVQALSPHAAVALMWEPWEFRASDIDMLAIADTGVPVIATNEGHPEVRTFDYLGPTIGRLLLDAGIEISHSQIVVIGSDPFGDAVAGWLTRAGAVVERQSREAWQSLVRGDLIPDAVVIVEHRHHLPIVTSSDSALLDRLALAGSPIVRLCGVIDTAVVRAHGVTLLPDVDAAPGAMTVTTAYAGCRPVVDLHAAGLKAASIVVNARRGGASAQQAVEAAVASGYGLELKLEELAL